MNTIEGISSPMIWTISVVILLGLILPAMIRILREYERGVIFRLGKLLRK